MTTKLKVWNGALTLLGHRRLSDTGEAVPAGHELTAAWDDVLAEAITEGSWNFATETVKLDYDTGITPNFGYRRVFAKPTDWVRTVMVSEDEYFTYPLIHYYDDDTFFSADNSPIYLRYVSNDTGLGYDLNNWPAKFTRFVQYELAARVCYKLTQSGSLLEQIMKGKDDARRTALNQDSMNEPQPKFPPPSSWTMARGGGYSRRDRGNRGSFTG